MKENIFELVSKELKILRIENGLSQEELSKKSKISISSIVRYEQKDSDIKLSTLEKLIKPYGISLFIFFERIIAKMQ